MAISDIHIHPWKANSFSLENGINNRLYSFLYLADDLLEIAVKLKLNVIAIAGDILHTPTVTPEELYIAEKFVEKLTSNDNIKLIVISGNHDLKYKGDSPEAHNSVLPPILSNKKNYYYVDRPQIIDIDGVTFHLAPWTLNTFKDYEKCDVFMGHGAVVGCKDINEYEFKSGFVKDDLFSNYKLSIIGDIHRPHLHEDGEGNYVVQPGNTVCNTYSDSPEAGCWVIELGKKPMFIPNSKFTNSDKYYTYISVNSEEEEVDSNSRPNTFYKIRGKSKKDKSIYTGKSESTSDILELYNAIAEKDKPETLSVFEGLYKETQSSNTRVPLGISLNKLTVSNFQSISNLELDFKNINELLIVGQNGSGKSSVFSSLFFALTGNMDRNVDLNDLIKKGESELKVELEISNSSGTYQIIRTRNIKNVSSLDFIKDNLSLRSNSIKDTQNKIYDVLGCIEEDIFTFCYFSASNYTSFSSLKNGQKYEIISRLAQLNKIDSIRDVVTNKVKEAKQSVSNLKFYKEKLEKDIFDNENKVNYINSLSEEEIDNIDDLNRERKVISDSIENLLVKKSEYEGDVQKQSSITIQLSNIEKELKRYKKEFSDLSGSIKSLSSNICPECSQHYSSPDVDKKISTMKLRQKQVLDIATVDKQKSDKLKSEVKAVDFIDFSEISKLTRRRELIDKKIIELNNKPNNKLLLASYTQMLEENNIKLVEAVSQYNDSESKYNVLNSIKSILDKNGELTTSLLQSSINRINLTLKELLKDSPYSVTVIYDGSITMMCKVNGIVLNYESLSSGEKKVVELALIVAFNNVYNEVFNLERGLIGNIFLDEIFTFLDPENLNLCKQILESLQSSCILITHEEELKNLFPRKILVEKVNNSSVYHFQ